ncbi:MAG TPA: MFS transporter [Bacillota bacterium]|nr:MFS transporter [Bacillota bacterium]
MEREIFKYKLFFFVRYIGDAFFYPFMSIYFIFKGLSEEQLGWILAITPITTIIANPVWNWIVKDSRISQTVLKFMTVIEGLLIILITRVNGFELFALIIGLIGLLCSPFMSIQDGFAATYALNNHIEFSQLRIYASIAYVLATTVAGFTVQYLGYEILFLLSGAFFLVTAGIAWWIKPLEKPSKVKSRPKRDLRALITNKNFLKYLLFYTLTVGAIRIGDSFFGVYITDQKGLSTLGWGLVYSGFVFFEVLVLRYLSIKGGLIDEKKLFLFAVSILLFRFLTYSLDLPLPAIVAFTMLRGVSWGVYIYTHIRYLSKIVRVENITAAILIVTLLYSIFAAVGSMFAGAIIERFGYSIFFLSLSGLILAGLVSFLILTPKVNQMQNNE